MVKDATLFMVHPKSCWLLLCVILPACVAIAPAQEPNVSDESPLFDSKGQLLLVKDHKPVASIVIAEDAPEQIVKSAKLLQEIITQMTGAELPFRDDSKDWPGTQVLIGPSRLNTVVVPQGLDEPQGYRIVVKDHRVSLVGNDAAPNRGTLHAVYDLLEQFGCGWFGPDPLYQVIPKRSTLALAPMDRREAPVMTFRSLWNVPNAARDAWRLGGPAVECRHIYSTLFPRAEYYDQNPEYFALVNGKRESTQICFSNPDVQQITIEKTRAFFDKNPTALTASLSANDNGYFCECENCTAMGENAGAQSLAFANIVAKELAKTHPDKLVTFLAYWYTLAAPSNKKAEPNVMIMVVNQGCHAHALDDPNCPANKAWCQNFEKLLATGAKLAVYEWYIPGCSQLHWRKLPWTSTNVALRNLRYWHSKGVRWVMYESQPAYEDGDGYPRRWPLYYLAARGMWNPNADPNQLLRDACDRLYGPAAEPMYRYFNTGANAVERTAVVGSGWNLPPAEDIFQEDVMADMRRALADAMTAVANADQRTWQRVATEVTLWHESEQALKTLPPETRNMIDARDYNGGIWFTDKSKAKGFFLRDFVGIGSKEPLFIMGSDGKKHPIDDKQDYDLSNGVRIVR